VSGDPSTIEALGPKLNDWGGVLSVLIWLYVLLYGALCFALLVALFLAGGLIWDRQRHAFNRVSSYWGIGLSHTLPLTLEFRHLERIGAGPYVIVSNHGSVIDLLILCLLPLRYRTIVRRGWYYSPWGLNILLSGHVPTEKSGDIAGGKRVLEACARYLRQGVSMLIFPEGHRAVSWKVERFRRGAFELATSTRTPVLPIAIAGSNDVGHRSTWRFALFRKIVVEILPLQQGVHDPRQLRDQCRRLISDRVVQLRAELKLECDQGPITRHHRQ
jgi:1-acyl-sn-glycerol-3-phosphate acyltransferase